MAKPALDIPAWETLERKVFAELSDMRKKHKPVRKGEVEHSDFEWRGRKVHCEKFLKVDLDDDKDPFRESNIFEEIEDKLKAWDDENADRKVPRNLVQLVVAKATPEMMTEPGKAIAAGYAECYLEPPGKWPAMEVECRRALIEDRKGFPKKTEYTKRYAHVMASWDKTWSQKSRERISTLDKKHINNRNNFTSAKENNILRRPSHKGDHNALYIAFDRDDTVLIFLDPDGIQTAYKDLGILEKIKADTQRFYSVKAPNPDGNKRHISAPSHMKLNPHLRPDQCGSDHYGHWHPNAHPQGVILETGDSMDLNATNRQLLLQFLKTTGGVVTRVLDFWYGVWDPKKREEFRGIYRNSPEFARLPPTNRGHEETWCLRVTVCNRPTDEHRDHLDIKRGMTGLVQIGEFQGTCERVLGYWCKWRKIADEADAAMCINKLGIALEGYKDGAVLLFRGTDMYHYVSQWKGEYRYAFDHTTHASVAAMVEHHRKNGVWRDPALIKDDNDPNEAKIKKKAANLRKREANGSGEEEKEEVPRPRKKAARVKAKVEDERSDEGQEEDEVAKPRKGAAKAKTATRAAAARKTRISK